MHVPQFWKCVDQPIKIPFHLCGSSWYLSFVRAENLCRFLTFHSISRTISFEAVGDKNDREFVCFRLQWLGREDNNDYPYRGSVCLANFFLKWKRKDKSEGESEPTYGKCVLPPYNVLCFDYVNLNVDGSYFFSNHSQDGKDTYIGLLCGHYLDPAIPLPRTSCK